MFRSSILVTLLAICASLLGFFVQVILAQRFGIGVEIEAYLFAISFPTYLAGLIGAILSFNLIPRLIFVKANSDYHHDFIGSVLIVLTIISVGLMLLMGVVLITLLDCFLPSKSLISEYSQLQILIIFSCQVGAVQIVQGYIFAILNSEKKYIYTAFLTLMPYVGMLTLFYIMDRTVGAMPIVLGMLVGSLLAVLIGLWLLRELIFPLPWKAIAWRSLLDLAYSSAYAAMAISCFSAYAVIDAYWGPRAGDGVLATLGYAQRLVIAIGNLAIAGPSAILVPHLSENLRDKKYGTFINLMLKAFLIVSLISSAAAIFITIYASEIVDLLFANSILDELETSNITNTITSMAPGMVAMLLSVIGLRVLFCFENSKKIVAIVGVLWTLGYFYVSSLVYLNGAAEIASAYSIVWFITFMIIAYLIYKKTCALYE